MNFDYTRNNLTAKENIRERRFEILPGLLSWTMIIGICLASFIKPLITSVFMIAFLLYWLLRLIYMNIFLIASYMHLAKYKNIDWMERIKLIDSHLSGKFVIMPSAEKTRLWNCAFNGQLPPLSSEIYHLVIIPVIRETADIVGPGLEGIKNGQYPSRNIFIVIAVEESANCNVKNEMSRLQEKFKNYFLDLKLLIHPANVPGEAKVKGANTTFAAKRSAEYLREKKIPFENILCSCFDADTVPEPNYFSCLTYNFMMTEERTKASFQPIPVYHNNIWEAPSFARIIDIGTSFFQLIEATNPRKLVTFSSHSMSFKALVEVGYWPVDMISDDSAIFWKAFIRYDGNYHVVPIYTTVSMDIAIGKTLKQTIQNIYKQKRRWAWGVENIPIVMRAFLISNTISFYKKISYGYKLLDSFISWATWSFVLLFGTWLPVFFVNKEFTTSTVFYTAPRIRQIIYGMSTSGIFVCMVISLLLLPMNKFKHSPLMRLRHTIEWISIPVFIVLLSALPALDAQTRLMFGKYMEFWVSDKYRRK